MKSLGALLVVAALAVLAPMHATAREVKVIANSSVQADTITGDDLKRIYLEERNSLADGTHAEPVLKKGGAAHDSFLKEFLNLNDDALQTYYHTLVFTGRGSMPRTFDSDAEVVAYVARTRGAIGYVNEGAAVGGVKTLTIVDTSNTSERKLLTRVEPDYPETLKRLNIGGTVRLQVTISAKGNVERVELLGGNPILGESAIVAVRQWVYGTAHARSVAEVSIAFDSHR